MAGILNQTPLVAHLDSPDHVKPSALVEGPNFTICKWLQGGTGAA